ncbi:hypothetical protein [Bdellovibrio sp. HCB337]|uniref:hypothetical protein n=1 Tax=Bdellovibrio sp. HCB337 TaxID=3394358 RepID=UPI0039A5AB2C
MFHFRSLLALFVMAFAFNAGAQSSGGGGEFTKRAERRESSRWTLQEWLAQKDRNRMMDMWLSMNSPSPYELMLGVSYNSYELDAGGGAAVDKNTSYQGTFSAYAQFVGLTAEYENNTQEGFNDLSGLFNLRLLGSSIQGSYLTLHYGMRTRNQNAPELRISQQFAQVSLQMYAIKQFGFDGLYRSYLPTTEATLGDVKGTLTEGGAFIDFKNFRVFGSWYKDVQSTTNAGTTVENIRTGIRSGLKIFF